MHRSLPDSWVTHHPRRARKTAADYFQDSAAKGLSASPSTHHHNTSSKDEDLDHYLDEQLAIVDEQATIMQSEKSSLNPAAAAFTPGKSTHLVCTPRLADPKTQQRLLQLRLSRLPMWPAEVAASPPSVLLGVSIPFNPLAPTRQQTASTPLVEVSYPSPNPLSISNELRSYLRRKPKPSLPPWSASHPRSLHWPIGHGRPCTRPRRWS